MQGGPEKGYQTNGHDKEAQLVGHVAHREERFIKYFSCRVVLRRATKQTVMTRKRNLLDMWLIAKKDS